MSTCLTLLPPDRSSPVSRQLVVTVFSWVLANRLCCLPHCGPIPSSSSEVLASCYISTAPNALHTLMVVSSVKVFAGSCAVIGSPLAAVGICVTFHRTSWRVIVSRDVFGGTAGQVKHAARTYHDPSCNPGCRLFFMRSPLRPPPFYRAIAAIAPFALLTVGPFSIIPTPSFLIQASRLVALIRIAVYGAGLLRHSRHRDCLGRHVGNLPSRV